MQCVTANALLEANDDDLISLEVTTPLERKRLRFGLLFNSDEVLSVTVADKDWYKKWAETPEHLRRAYAVTSQSVNELLMRISLCFFYRKYSKS